MKRRAHLLHRQQKSKAALARLAEDFATGLIITSLIAFAASLLAFIFFGAPIIRAQ